jgi:hypothetical protein
MVLNVNGPLFWSDLNDLEISGQSRKIIKYKIS